MNVWLVSPAWGRFAVTRLALAQRRHLCDELALRGISADCIVIADDENIDIAGEFGFPAIEMSNTYLGAKVNAGFEYAGEQGADFVAFVGSDDWMHPDLFDTLRFLPVPRPPVVAGRVLTLVDLERGLMRQMSTSYRYGVIPWLIPRWVLEASDFRPLPNEKTRGIDLNLALGLGSKPEWVFHDPHPLARVDFKSDMNMTPYRAASGSPGRHGEIEEPWETLVEKYPAELVSLAEKTCYELRHCMVAL